jgi:hypothetical protein
LTKLVVGMHDYSSGLDMESFSVTADFPIDGIPAGENLAKKFQSKGNGVWEWMLPRPLAALPNGKLTVAVKDRQGNLTRVERSFSIAK